MINVEKRGLVRLELTLLGRHARLDFFQTLKTRLAPQLPNADLHHLD